MVLTKREKILLQVLIVFGLISLILAFLVLPGLNKATEYQAQIVDVEERLAQAEEVLESEGLEEELKVQKAQAEEYYEFFYSALNGYTIDGIFNSLIQKNALTVNRLHIGPYESADLEFAKKGSDVEGEETAEDTTADTGTAENETGNVLVRSMIDVQVLGTRESILNFIDDLNKQSLCLRVGSVSIYPNTNAAFVEQMQSCDLKMYVYGINAGEQDLNFQ